MKAKQVVIIFVPLLITLGFWLIIKFANPLPFSIDTSLYYAGQLTGLLGMVLLSQSYILATRLKPIENLFDGLDKSYKAHAAISKTAFALVLLHPALLAFALTNNFEQFLNFIKPELPLTPLTFGSMAFLLYTFLILISIFRFMPYEMWKFSHKFIGVPFLLAGYHAFYSGADLSSSLPLKVWMTIVVLAGTLAYLYKVFLYKYLGPVYKYSVSRIKKMGDKTEIYLKTKKKQLKFNAGEFVFVSFVNNKAVPREQHPFSLSSRPGKTELRITFKTLGDFTAKLAENVSEGDRVDIYGPYGHFNSQVFKDHKKQIWIAGGIGVTPFLSMLEYEYSRSDKEKIHFIYCSRNEKDAVYQKEISTLASQARNINVVNYFSDTEGVITAEVIAHKIKQKLDDYLILLCGPFPMMIALKKQFMQLGVPEKNISFEEFNLV